jgi:ribosomal-protein-alanine N-acetyltransferase
VGFVLPLPEGLSDELVRLRGFEEADAVAVFDACQDPLIRRFTTFPEAKHPDEVREWIRSQADQRRRGGALDLAVTARGDGRLLGAVGLGSFVPEHGRAAAGYWLAPGERGRGFATAALRLLSDWSLSSPLSLARVELHMDVDNTASARTAEGAGFEREGLLRSYLSAKDRRWDVLVYARVDAARRDGSPRLTV